MSVWKCVKDFLLFVQICLSRRGLTELGQGGLPLLVVHEGRSKRYTLRLVEVEVEGEWGARDLLLLMLRGDRPHRRVHPILWTRHSTMSSIIRSSLNFSRVISIRRVMSITRGIRLSFTRGTSLSSLLSSSSMSSLLSNNSMSSILSSSMQSLLWRMRMGAFQGGLMRCHFYRTSVNTWHAGFATVKQ